MISDKVIGRLSQYRHFLRNLDNTETTHIYSHELASSAGVTPGQVRRDIMNIGYSGNPNRGYEIKKILKSMENFLDAHIVQRIALVGVGNMGRAILAYFSGRHPKLSIVASFDSDPEKYDRVIHGCRCYSLDDLEYIISEMNIKVAVITVPVQEAQNIADQLVDAGIKGILNFAPITIQTPSNVYLGNIDITTSLEKVAYFARTM